jgi:hypothetical protein
MPHIIVLADRPNERGEGPVMLSERVTGADFQSEHFAAHLVQRLGWAVTDADAAENDSDADVEWTENGAYHHARAGVGAGSD